MISMGKNNQEMIVKAQDSTLWDSKPFLRGQQQCKELMILVTVFEMQPPTPLPKAGI